MGRLLDELHSIPATRTQGEPCKVGAALALMDVEDRLDFEEMLRRDVERPIGARRISASLSAINVTISGTAINEHRARICRCYRKVS